MTTLTQASITARKSIRYGIYGIIIIFIARLTLITAISLYKKAFPPAPEPANIAFGKLPLIPFPERTKTNLTFSLETPEGGIPVFSPKTNVYFMPKKIANLLSLDFAKNTAKKLGYNPDPQQISDSLYKFSHRVAPASLEIDIITGAFSISFDLNTDPTPLTIRPGLPETSSKIVKDFLSDATLLPSDLTGEIKYSFLKTQAGGFIQAVSLSDANLIRVDLFRKSYNDLLTVTNVPSEANVWFIVSGLREEGRDIIAGEYHYFPIDETQVATYPIKSGETAWQELLSGNYFPASNGSAQEAENIKIRKIYLAYYDSGKYTEFFQPVYVFEGDKNFIAYVAAVTSENYGE